MTKAQHAAVKINEMLSDVTLNRWGHKYHALASKDRLVISRNSTASKWGGYTHVLRKIIGRPVELDGVDFPKMNEVLQILNDF